MERINRLSLTNPSALAVAGRVLRDMQRGLTLSAALGKRQVPDCLAEDVTAILDAVQAGWFLIPRGQNLSYSADQYDQLFACSRSAPWLIDLAERAARFEERRRGRQSADMNFGVQRLPDWLIEARNAPARLHRLPLEHVTGQITPDLWVQILEDTQQTAIRIEMEMECFEPAWMWDADHALSQQVARLMDLECGHLLLPYVSTTRNRYLDPFEVKLLKQVQHQGKRVDWYEAQWQQEKDRRAEEQRRIWGERFALIQRLASVLDGVTTYHQGSLTRKLNAETKGGFSILRDGINGECLTFELGYQFVMGIGQQLDTVFKLVNYCLAVADALEDADPCFEAYLEACELAGKRVDALTEGASQGDVPLARPRDDFEVEAA